MLNEATFHFAMASSVRWYGHVLRAYDRNILRRAIEFEVDGQMKKGRPKSALKMGVDEESMKVGYEHGRCTLSTEVDYWR